MIYLDNSATTPICKDAKDTIIKYLDCYGNPSSLYDLGQQSRKIIEDSREEIANLINANPSEIYFTSGGSEANTWISVYKQKFSSEIEHKSNIANSEFFKVNNDGIVDIEDFKKSLQEITYYMRNNCIVSCMYVNNEIGTIQPIQAMADICHEYNFDFHTDAVQAMSHIKIDVQKLGCDFLSASGHKFGSPKGVGFLFAKNNKNLYNLIHGGLQEQGRRPGTENILGIASMAVALKQTYINLSTQPNYVKKLRNYMVNKLLKISGSHLNNDLSKSIDSIINIRFDGVNSADLVSICNMYNLCISTGSACNEGTEIPSHVLKAIGLSDKQALESIRISIGYQNTYDEINKAIMIITNSVKNLRNYKT